MKQQNQSVQKNKESESFNADLCMLVLCTTRSVDEQKLQPITLK